jgi:lipopolysaccharide export system permease protein
VKSPEKTGYQKSYPGQEQNTGRRHSALPLTLPLFFPAKVSKLLFLKTLHRYLTGQVLASLILTVAVFTFVLLLGTVIKEVLELLITGHVRLWVVAEAIVMLIPFVWVFALPMGMLTATLLVFGRFSADQELTAARASGISLLSLVMPVLLLSLFCCALSAWFSTDLGPRSRVAYLDLRSELETDLANMQLPEGRFINISTNYVFYAEKNDGGKLENVMIQYQRENSMLQAPHGDIEFDLTNNQLLLNLYQATIVTRTTNGPPRVTSLGKLPIVVDLDIAKKGSSKLQISNMTFWQLREKLQELQAQLPETLPTNDTSASLGDIRKLPQNLIEQVRVEMQRQLAFSFAPFAFALVGIPLGIRVHRRETNIGVAIALMLVLIYYSFIMLAQQLSSRPELSPHLILWLPDFLFQAIGAFLLWRANRGI